MSSSDQENVSERIQSKYQGTILFWENLWAKKGLDLDYGLKLDIKNRFSDSFSQEMYTFIYITVIIRKLQGAIFFTI